MTTGPPAISHLPRFAAALLFLLPTSNPHTASALTQEATHGVELRGHWRAMRGFVGAGGSLTLRQPDGRRVSLRLTLPALGALPEAQVFLRDGDALLLWQEPASARPLIDAEEELLSPLRLLPPSAWLALLTGEGLSAHFRVDRRGEERGFTLLTGSLAGWPAELRGPPEQARKLSWESPAGEITLLWRPLPEVRKILLTLQIEDRVHLRILLRTPRRRAIGPAGWLFSDDSAKFREP